MTTPTKTARQQESVVKRRSEEIGAKNEKQLITVNFIETGSIIEGLVFDVPSKIFLDTGAMVNLISLEYLRKVKPGVIVLNPTNFVLQGVTGKHMEALGEIEIPILIDYMFRFDIKAVVVKDSSFPGDLLIGYETMKEEDIALFPARGGAKLSFKFIPFLTEQKQATYTTPVTQSTPASCDMSSVVNNYNKNNNVAERSTSVKTKDAKDSLPPVAEIPIQPVEDNALSTAARKSPHPEERTLKKTPETAQTMLLATGYVAGSTLLHSMTVNKVKVVLKGVKTTREIIALPETSKLKGCYLDSAVYMSHDGTVDVLLANTLNKDIILKPGTQVGSFEICEQPIRILNEAESNSNSGESFVCPIQVGT